MTTIAHRLSRLLPGFAARALRPTWHRVRDLVSFMASRGGRIARNRDLGAWVASRPMSNGKRMRVVVRSYKEFRRFYNFGRMGALAHPAGTEELLDRWIRSIDDCEVLYDVGSSTGLEGFYVYHLHGAKIIFVEPYTPSIETILKTVWLRQKDGAARDRFEVVQAACDATESYKRLYMHDRPVPGATANSFADAQAYTVYDGRGHWPIVASQWVKSVSLDSLHHVHGLPLATHVKIDVDGFEERVMEGATKLLASKHVRSWAIEISGREKLQPFAELMRRHGYIEVASQEHYPGYKYYTGDHIFVRDDLAGAWDERA